MKILLVDDHALIAASLRILLLDIEPDAHVLAAANAIDAKKLLDTHPDADLMLLDLALPGVSGTSLLEAIRGWAPNMKVLVLSGYHDQRSVERVLQLGASGFVPKSMATDTLVSAIKLVLSGGAYIPRDLLDGNTQSVAVPYPVDPPRIELTQRQEQILYLLARGAQRKSICRELGLSEGSVKAHVRSIYRALGASNRTEALFAARRLGYEVG
jgi:DNA-binding NarL/FixJ family response regulator